MFLEKMIIIQLVHQSFPEFWAPKEVGCGSVERVSAHSLNFHSLEENCQEKKEYGLTHICTFYGPVNFKFALSYIGHNMWY